MDFKRHFLYQADYQHWANDALFNALDHLDEDRRRAPQKVLCGSIHGCMDHLLFFSRKWSARLKGEPFTASYAHGFAPEWRDLKNALRQEIRDFQRWLEHQPETFFDGKLTYRRTLNHELRDIWVRDALVHVFTYAALERGQISALGSAMGAPFPDMAYYTYRLEMGEHLEHMHKA